ncbi:MFS transporter [Shimia ponticola]|uniref:MFS transporter n=1 Tax=Shimia ponticola TaxID=2582893 RepID=UPI0011BFBC5A|nr:MFS transporter [Shimia ponticola]
MLSVLQDKTYRRLFLAQIVALMGTGLATVALGLLAYELAGGNAALLLGTIFAIKMVAYVTVAPIAAALAERLPRRKVLIALDLVRGAVALALPFVTETWQVYVLILILQSASAGFTPIFQATIPDILPEEDRYTRALSLSRLAYDLESLLSPAMAALLLLIVSHDALFVGTSVGFLASALLVLSVALPAPKPAQPRPFYDRTTRGVRIYLATPRLRGLLGFSMAVSAAGAMVLVNTVVLVKDSLGMTDTAVAVTMAAFGGGSMVAALALPRLLDRWADRPVMTAGACAMVAGLLGLLGGQAAFGLSLLLILGCWGLIGLGYSAVLTPSGRLLRRSAQPEDRPAIFAAQFALSHACWLITYPLAGLLMTVGGAALAVAVLAALATGGILVALRQWPKDDPLEVEHEHPDLPRDHPHLRGGRRHRHPFTIDDLHPSWPTSG